MFIVFVYLCISVLPLHGVIKNNNNNDDARCSRMGYISSTFKFEK